MDELATLGWLIRMAKAVLVAFAIGGAVLYLDSRGREQYLSPRFDFTKAKEKEITTWQKHRKTANP